MPTIVPNVADKEQRAARLSSLRFILDSAETVDESCVNYLAADGSVDMEQIACNSVSNLVRDLAELDAIVSSMWEYPLMEAVTSEARLGTETVERARALAQAIREAVASTVRTDLIPTSTDTGEIVDEQAIREADDAL